MVNMFVKEYVVLVLHCTYAKMVSFGSCIQSDKFFPHCRKTHVETPCPWCVL